MDELRTGAVVFALAFGAIEWLPRGLFAVPETPWALVAAAVGLALAAWNHAAKRTPR